METIRAPKRSRKERGCITRTFKYVVVDAAIYDRDRKKEVRKNYELTGSACDMTTEKLVKYVRTRVTAEFKNAVFLDFNIVRTEEVRYVMTESEFIKNAQKVEH